MRRVTATDSQDHVRRPRAAPRLPRRRPGPGPLRRSGRVARPGGGRGRGGRHAARRPVPAGRAHRARPAGRRHRPRRAGRRRPARRPVRPARRRVRAVDDGAHLRHRPHPVARLGTRGRGRRVAPRPRRQHPALGRRRRARRRHRPVARLRPGHRRARRRAPAALRPHPARRRHRGLQPLRHPSRRGGRRPARPTTSAPWCTSTRSHLAAHVAVDLEALGADFLVCSPYKFFGPHLGAARRRPRPPRDAATRQAAALERRRAGALRARHAALRAAGRRHGGRGVRRGVGDGGRRGARAGAAGPPARRPRPRSGGSPSTAAPRGVRPPSW